jgi:hypothetical protein
MSGEREKLEASFGELGNAVDDAIGDLSRKAKEAGRKALVIGPAVVAGVAGLVVARRRRRRRKSREAEPSES